MTDIATKTGKFGSVIDDLWGIADPDAIWPLDDPKKQRGAYANSVKTHCTRGHEFTAENTYLHPGGSRHCRKCKALWRLCNPA